MAENTKRRTLAGGANLACGGPGGRGPEVGWDWRDAVDALERDGLGVDQSHAQHESHVTLQCANVRNFCRNSSVADAVSLISTSSQKTSFFVQFSSRFSIVSLCCRWNTNRLCLVLWGWSGLSFVSCIVLSLLRVSSMRCLILAFVHE